MPDTVLPREAYMNHFNVPLMAMLLGLLVISENVIAQSPGVESADSSQTSPNILFIGVDDLRPELASYGATYIQSPNIDRIAAEGVLFDRAYAQWAVCMQSRASLLTGLRPDSFSRQAANFREVVPDVVTLPQHFKNHGYFTQSFGKIFHGAWKNAYVQDRFQDPVSWSAERWTPSPQYYFSPEGIAVAQEVFATAPPRQLYLHGARRDPEKPDQWQDFFVRGLVTEAPEVADNVLADGRIADAAIKKMRELHARSESTPFFLAVGFQKPHLPFVAPKKYWDLYDPAKIPPVTFPDRPVGSPEFVTEVGAREITQYIESPVDQESSARARHLRHGYAASISYVDAQIGRLLDELDVLGIRDHTIVVLWSDHGFKLGEFGVFGKNTNFELDTRVPLIISAPGLARGERSGAVVELVDLHPTLSELAGLPVHPGAEGESFASNVKDTEAVDQGVAFSQIPYARWPALMGYSVRTATHRYTEWRDLSDVKRTGDVLVRELYEYGVDGVETKNLADAPAYLKVQQRLQQLLNNP
jgi:iduronate 2-sulfatase